MLTKLVVVGLGAVMSVALEVRQVIMAILTRTRHLGYSY